MTEQTPMHDGQYREIIARFEGLAQRVADIHSDAREARDAAHKLTERVAAQDIPTKLAELGGRVEQGFQAARTDLVNSMDKITRETRSEFAIQDKRIEALEAFRSRIEGAGGVFGWLSRHAPWLFTAILAALAAVGFKDNL